MQDVINVIQEVQRALQSEEKINSIWQRQKGHNKKATFEELLQSHNIALDKGAAHGKEGP